MNQWRYIRLLMHTLRTHCLVEGGYQIICSNLDFIQFSVYCILILTGTYIWKDQNTFYFRTPLKRDALKNRSQSSWGVGCFKTLLNWKNGSKLFNRINTNLVQRRHEISNLSRGDKGNSGTPLPSSFSTLISPLQLLLYVSPQSERVPTDLARPCARPGDYWKWPDGRKKRDQVEWMPKDFEVGQVLSGSGSYHPHSRGAFARVVHKCTARKWGFRSTGALAPAKLCHG